MISSTMPSAKYSCSGSPLILANGSTAIEGLSGSGSAGLPSPASRGTLSRIAGEGGPRRARGGVGEGRAHPVDPHWAGNVFYLLLAQILEDKGQPVAHVVMHRIGDEHAAGIGQGFDPGGDVDAVAVEVVALDDHVAEIDADAQFDAVLRRDTRVPLGYRLLHRDRAAHRIDDAGKFPQQAVAGGFDDAAAVLGDFRIEKLAAQRLEAFERAFLVRPHQPRIPRHIGGEDRGEPAGRDHASGTPALRKPSQRRSFNSPVGGRFSVIHASENSGRSPSNVSRASAAAVSSSRIASVAVRKKCPARCPGFFSIVARAHVMHSVYRLALKWTIVSARDANIVTFRSRGLNRSACSALSMACWSP